MRARLRTSERGSTRSRATIALYWAPGTEMTRPRETSSRQSLTRRWGSSHRNVGSLDMFDAMDASRPPRETFYDGYVVNAIIDAAYRSIESRQWEPVKLEVWRGAAEAELQAAVTDYDAQYFLIKQERMPDGKLKLILKDKQSGEIVQKFQ